MLETFYNSLNEELKSRGLAVIVCEAFALLLIISMALFGNSCVLMAVYRNPQLRTIPNYFIGTLAISDILLPLVCGPQTVAAVILGRWPFSQDACQVQGYFVMILACASLQILTLTAINRFYRIVQTRHYRRIFTKRKTVFMITLCFGFAFLEPLPYFLSGRRYSFHPAKLFCFQTTEISIPNLLVYVYVGAPVVTLSICYFLVFKKIRIHQQDFQSNLELSSSIDGVTQRDIKVTKVLFVTVVGFLACWTPIIIIDFVDTFREKVTFPRQVYFLYLLLGNLSSAINPFVYGVLNKNFREEYKKIFLFKKKKKRVERSQESRT